ncbi:MULTISPECIES: YtxH domain-containing protein [Streptomyces]|uniref:YtxH domain-containing protein n=1 Tax=Streptomyces TaxID=1883 RepID=UPI00163C4CA6|nr:MULTISPECIES: YtxH domain-containing protein [Streptomyces]MBC2874094.1 YtxH domain-containing protein [Streptomyces sp. TYQ1024]UBI38973.1 YtxH domain-containing protein [Streptomyces mobaraensis]UKW31551.1 YtxH domain-containing protein [Streptomyces sp. TYQ1024]
MRYRLTFIAGAAVGYVLGARAGRERYEELRKGVRRIAQNPAVRNTAETAAVNGKALAGRALGKVGDRVPGSVADRVRSLREQRSPDEDEWGTSNT